MTRGAQISGMRFLALLGMTLRKRMRNGCHSERKSLRRGIYRVQRAHRLAPFAGYAKVSIIESVGQRPTDGFLFSISLTQPSRSFRAQTEALARARGERLAVRLTKAALQLSGFCCSLLIRSCSS